MKSRNSNTNLDQLEGGGNTAQTIETFRNFNNLEGKIIEESAEESH